MKNQPKKINKVLFAAAGSSLNNKTGPWRTHRPITDLKKCIGCSLCAKICPEACIDMKNQGKKLQPQTDYDYCKGCALCVAECPVKAISLAKDY